MLNRLKTFTNKVIEYMNKPEMLTLPSSLAYYFIIAIVPIISILLIIASNLSLSTNYITTFFEQNFSSEVAGYLTPMVTNQGLNLGFIIYVVVAFFIVSNGADAIIIASNMIFNIKNQSYIKRRMKAFLLTFVLFLILTFMLIVPVFGSQIIDIIKGIGFNNTLLKTIELLYKVLNLPLTLFLIYISIKWIYVIAPDEHIKASYVTKGAIFTTLGWFLTTIIYSYYVKNIATYNIYYAGFSSIIMLMVWFYFLAFIFVIGLSMNYQIAEEQIEKTNAIKLKEIEEKVKASKSGL